MKHLKAKLMMSVMSLILATIMLTSVSFAWFTISTHPEISDMTSSVTANGNLEIALDAGEEKEPAASAVGDAGKNETWGNLVDLEGYFVDAESKKTVRLKPVKVEFDENGAATISRPVFGYDGRISSVSALTRIAVADDTDDNFKDFGGLWVYTDKDDTSTGDAVWAYEVDYWLRTNVAGDITLTEPELRGDSASELGLGSWISNNKVTVKLVDVAAKTVYTLKLADTADTDGHYALTLCATGDDGTAGDAASIALAKDTAKLLKMYVYMDGVTLKNSDFLNEEGTCDLNVQFKHSVDLKAMEVAEVNYNRDTANGGSGTPVTSKTTTTTT